MLLPTTLVLDYLTTLISMIKTIGGMNYVFSFGRYRGKKFWEVLKDDPKWIKENINIKFIITERLMNQIKDKL